MIFVDTGPFLARHISSDSYHKDALLRWDRIARDKEPMATSHFVLDGLLLVDLRPSDPKLLRRYMGDEGLDSFMRYHSSTAPLALSSPS